jgi:hypothetical protein
MIFGLYLLIRRRAVLRYISACWRFTLHYKSTGSALYQTSNKSQQKKRPQISLIFTVFSPQRLVLSPFGCPFDASTALSAGSAQG